MNTFKSWLARLGSHLQPLHPSGVPRLPAHEIEAERVHRRWDSLNGRYYFTADLVLEDGTLLWDVLFGRRVTAWLVTKDCTGSGRYGEATAEQREAFRETRGGGIEGGSRC